MDPNDESQNGINAKAYKAIMNGLADYIYQIKRKSYGRYYSNSKVHLNKICLGHD